MGFSIRPPICLRKYPLRGSKMFERGVWRKPRRGHGPSAVAQIQGHTVLGQTGHHALHAAPVARSLRRQWMAALLRADWLISVRLTPPRRPFRGWSQCRARWVLWLDGLGWLGVSMAPPSIEIGFAYIPTALNYIDLFNERGKSPKSDALWMC